MKKFNLKLYKKVAWYSLKYLEKKYTDRRCISLLFLDDVTEHPYFAVAGIECYTAHKLIKKDERNDLRYIMIDLKYIHEWCKENKGKEYIIDGKKMKFKKEDTSPLKQVCHTICHEFGHHYLAGEYYNRKMVDDNPQAKYFAMQEKNKVWKYVWKKLKRNK